MQMEGGWNLDGKSPSVFDHAYLNKAAYPTHGTPYRAANHYNQTKQDLAYLGQLGATAYRFSVAWSRILPGCTGAVNQAGIKYYNDMIDEVRNQGAEPFLTMFHWDLPQSCQDQFGGFQSPQIIDAFANYAQVLLTNFGSKVNYWLTLNEPRANCDFCMHRPQFAPFTTTSDELYYQCMHNSIIAHATVVKAARKMPGGDKWKFSLPSIMEWHDPDPAPTSPTATEDASHIRQAEWYFDPCMTGDYGPGIKTARPLIPKFTAAQSALINGTCDYVAVNIYSSFTNDLPPNPIGEDAAYPAQEIDDYQFHFNMPYWPHPRPEGARALPNFLYKRYGKEIVIAELGYHVPRALETNFAQAVNDTLRVDFWKLNAPQVIASVVEDGVPLTAVLAWSLIDNYEFYTYEFRWGHIAVDYWDPSGNGKVNLDTGSLKRQVKNSALWMSDYFKKNTKSPFNNVVATGTGTSTTPKKTSGATESLFAGLFAVIVGSLISML
ncbi:glycoside hydrolase superfamily [Obelidium mucronatum]|nr:glycoside hydrolase superfamily [Obelidium mucronatum]